LFLAAGHESQKKTDELRQRKWTGERYGKGMRDLRALAVKRLHYGQEAKGSSWSLQNPGGGERERENYPVQKETERVARGSERTDEKEGSKKKKRIDNRRGW